MVLLKFYRNFFFKLIWIFEYKPMQSFECALLKGGIEDLFMLERPRWSATSLKLYGGFVGVAIRRGCSPVDLVVFFGACFNDSTSGGLLLHTEYGPILYQYCSINLYDCVYMYTHTCIYCTHTYVCLCMHVFVFVCECLYICILYIYIYIIYIYIYIC